MGPTAAVRGMSLGPGLKAAEIKRKLWSELRVARGVLCCDDEHILCFRARLVQIKI